MKLSWWTTVTFYLETLMVIGSFGFFIAPKEYCFGEIGCLVEDKDFHHPLWRPLNPPPYSRKKIQLTYKVHSKEDKQGTTFKGLETPKIIDTTFKVNRTTNILIHGYLDAEGDAWYPDMVKALLKFGDFNILTVNWKGGSKAPFTQAAINTRVVGLEIAFLVDWLKDHVNLDPKDVHIIGHSLGAHAAGYAGERIDGLGRISGLDPAEPLFQGLPPKVRLDPSDAKFVDVIHTDSDSILLLGLGLKQPVGHVDFYPNEGRCQPGCQNPLKASIDIIGQGFAFLHGLTPEQKVSVTCSHSRSAKLFTDSIVSTVCTYIAINCHSYKEFLKGTQGSCWNCGTDGMLCARMGIHADKWPGVGKPNKENIKMYLKTESGPKDYCK